MARKKKRFQFLKKLFSKKNRRSKKFKFVRNALLGVVVIVFLYFSKLFFWDVPRLADHNPQMTAFMQNHSGQIQYEWVPISKISPHLILAVVSAEDTRFMQHGGIDWEAMKNSFEKNLKEMEFARGASTITMQLVKNLYLSSSKNIFRKAVEIPLALKMEHDLSKRRILELYLNVIEWGDGIYGAEAASKHYFKKSVSSLSSYESAYLAAIIPNPKSWGNMPPGPYVAKRIQTLLARMKQVEVPKSQTETRSQKERKVVEKKGQDKTKTKKSSSSKKKVVQFEEKKAVFPKKKKSAQEDGPAKVIF